MANEDKVPSEEEVAKRAIEMRARIIAEKDAEKYQALNEELATSNEELQATNEELAAANEELLTIQTRLQQAYSELAESETRLAIAVRATNLGTWEYDPLHDELFLSEESRLIFGFPSDYPATFQQLFERIHPQDCDRVQTSLNLVANRASNTRYDITCRMLRFDNAAVRWIRIQGILVPSKIKTAARHIATVLDITESKRSEEWSAKLAAIVESSNDAIISKTLESVITSWNATAERMFGYNASEIIGDTIYRLIPPDLHDEEPRIIARLKNGERLEHFETRRLHRDGHLIDVSLTISPIKDRNGKIIGISKIARDITERKQDEIRKNDFIAMVSHELKTPLTSLTAIVQLLNAKLRDNGDGFVSTALHKANIQVKKMTGMVNGFLDVSRLQSGKLVIYKEAVVLDTLIGDIMEEFRLIAPDYTFQFLTTHSITVRADKDKIASVITNLISNAVKYSPKEEPVIITCQIVHDGVQVSVSDKGIGIKPSDKEMLFNRYYRVENEQTQRISGFGIGLYLSSEIIKQHQGEIWVESEFGKGSTFSFILPLHTPFDVMQGN